MGEENKRIVVKHERYKCIGCDACVGIAPRFWEMDESDHKADLKGSQKKMELVDGREEVVEYLEIPASDKAVNEEAAEFCPAACIHVTEENI